MPNLDSAPAALREHFGFEDFRAGQREVIDAILAGHDTVVVMPTGGGKSLCFQLPALMNEGATIVVSPLIALMKDQVDALHARNLPATFINSSVDFEEQKARIAGIRQGKYKLVYVAPERFRSAHFVEALKSVNVSLFAVDEAHCVSTWGHDFRPDFLRLKSAIEEIGRPQVVALTATATPHVRADIIEQLGLREPRAFVSGFDRPNLSIRVVHTQKEREKIAHVKTLAAKADGGSGIIYSSTRKSVEQVARRLQDAGLNVVAYHAGMEEAERTRAQDAFMSGRVQMIVATNAFGMGIDKADIRFVIHYHLPGSIEAYYQEIGRAGRDGLPSECVLLFNYADKRTQDYFIEGSYPPPELIAKVYEALVATRQQHIELSTHEIAVRASVRNEMAVQSALIILEKAGHIERGAAGENRAEVRLLMPPHLARETVGAKRSARDKQVLYALLGGYDLNERADIEIEINEFAETLGLDLASVRRALSSLSTAGVVSYKTGRRTRGLQMLDERPVSRLAIRPQDLARRAALEQRKLREMISFCYADHCYRAFILDYFGDRSHKPACGTCGVCVKGHAPSTEIVPAERVTEYYADEAESQYDGEESPFAREERGAATASAPAIPVAARTRLDKFVIENTPFASDLENELDRQSLAEHRRREAESFGGEFESTVRITSARALGEDETLCVRKILACVARMEGRYGKGILAATLRGSRSAKISQFGLQRLSTYGILHNMTQDEILLYVDALVAAGALSVTGGNYPTVAITALGNDVMRERASIKLALPSLSAAAVPPSSTEARGSRAAVAAQSKTSVNAPRVSTVDETYAFYETGMTIEEISAQRGIAEMTVEKHLADCILEGRPFDISRHVGAHDRALIEDAVRLLGHERLKPLRDALPRHVSYRMIRFVVADLQRAATAAAATTGVEAKRRQASEATR
ncbi:MAG TPA: RecQ family ATP-dependent DNA helicase [Pyrinomonadaceae bacterium]|nr:RecQ family ATP-dependent DNA helicase [Pyrinomonadaceae bacterium]